MIGLPRDKRLRAALAVFLLLAPAIVAWRSWVTITAMRPWAGAGIVVGKVETEPGPVILRLDDGSELKVAAISSRIDAGDRVEKQAGELVYVVNGRRLNPAGTVIGSLLFFWIFLPALAFMPVLIILRTKEG